MNRVPLILASVAVLVLSGCSVTVAGPTSEPPAPPSTSPAPVASGTPGPSVTASVTPGQVLPGYAPGQFPAIPLFSLPDTSVLSKGGKKLREKLELTLPDLPGVKVKAVQCGKDGTYINEDSSLVLYGDGSGSYVGPDGSYTRGRDGSETSVSGKESITRNGKGGGTYVSGDLSISNDGTGSGTYVSAEVSITLDGKGGGSYVGPLGSITNGGNGSGTSFTILSSVRSVVRPSRRSTITSAAKCVAPTPRPVKPATYCTRPPCAWPQNAQKRVEVSITPAQRWLNFTPASCGKVVKKWLASFRWLSMRSS